MSHASRPQGLHITCGRFRALALLALPALLSGGCGTQSAYLVAQRMQWQECQKLPDVAERSRCEKTASVPYDRYREQVETVRKPGPQ
jgi:hypothetical protein